MSLINQPLDLPFELCEFIFDYLQTRDLLACCLVSKSWLDFFNNSICHHKILLSIDETAAMCDLFNCTRKFVRIKLNKLKNERFLDILSHFAACVEELEIENCELKKECNMKFPSLKCLSISSTPAEIIHKIFNNPCNNLKCLVLYRLNGPTIKVVSNFLKTNDSLEEINFYLDEKNNIFNRDISNEVTFKLKSLFISYKSDYDLPTKTLTNIEKFLKSQGDTLETISLINSANLRLLFRTWNDLKAVNRLYFFSSDPVLDFCPLNVTELNKNSKITELELHALGPLSLNLTHFIPFLNAAIALKSLGVWCLKKDLIEYVAKNFDNLRFISCASMDSDCLTFYNDLKSKIGINDKIQIHQYL
ncbi:unnamed protein product [Chironomus riparius]|uniref:F-box domain-containing protein n=1 Tax=Chironomus riparius TaxID=315576 RepID=A0A9N9WT10_9DIPT|nr:unnamed protein product [Chironomus riparius]